MQTLGKTKESETKRVSAVWGGAWNMRKCGKDTRPQNRRDQKR